MQPFAFVPWAWRDESVLTVGYHHTGEADLGTGRTDSVSADEQAGADLSGYKVEATDGGIGEIDEATYDVGGAYLVVDTGPWIFGRKVLLPAGTMQRIDHIRAARKRSAAERYGCVASADRGRTAEPEPARCGRCERRPPG